MESRTNSVPEPLDRHLEPDVLRALVDEGGLTRMGLRPSLGTYIRQLWERRTFIRVLATSKSYAKNQNNYLGQLWSVLTPTLNAIVYILIFGVILGVGKAGIDNTIGFIVVGTFLYHFFTGSVNSGARAIRGNLNLVRSVRFPRAVLPISSVLAELATLGPALVVMCIFCWLAGYMPNEGPVPLEWRWLLIIPTVLLFWLFNTGIAFFMAKWVAITPDIQNVIPFVLRFVMYGSGVIFSLQSFIGDSPFAPVLEHQPIAVYLYLGRSSVLNEPAYPPSLEMWIWGIGWAAVTLTIGFITFWRGEERYGRD
ncbi:teichoic acid transport system permease protein [Paraoerskovia marina]|uniref:Teichoic acid transport system permease protein n=1 Tax=Paraoerskovia marina TaxID=545619 RepID=A0A1H1QVX4_9CELL|nr:ABC transporter permease [Paraoerskovia marina]SDS27604.1 teichoic acid transport system permease protein [Paraoerskovia marina]